MNLFQKKISVATLFFLASLISALAPADSQKKQELEMYDSVLGLFRTPPAEFRSAPLWVWNDDVSEQEIREQIADFKKKGIGGLFIHPRPGLITPYLSEQWLHLTQVAVAEGKKLGMNIWLYDENSYPSGFAGGHVPDQMPDSLGKGLRLTRMKRLPAKFLTPPMLILQKKGEAFVEVDATVMDGTRPEGDYYVFDLKGNDPSPWFGGFNYVDLMRPEVTAKFLEITLDAYKRAIGSDFGTTVPGVFQDEAEISPVSGPDVVNYTPALFVRFQQKWGYDLKPHLPSLFEETGEWKKIRHNYYSTLLDLFIDGWAKPYYNYCTANRLKLTGHYWEHEWPIPRISPDNMAMAAYAHMPGIDCLMNDWKTDPHAQFGNARSSREIASIANQLGKNRTMCETFGAGGWDMTFFDQKRIADWLYATGVNFITQHLAYMTIKGARKRDHPLSFSYHEPWWFAYPVLADYYGRLSAALSSGKQVNTVLVIEPTTSAWMYYSPSRSSERLDAIGTRFQNFVNSLEAAQIEYDLASEHTLSTSAAVEKNRLVIGQREYKLVILPPGMENINRKSLRLLDRFLGAGGKVLSWESTPKFLSGVPSPAGETLYRKYQGRWIERKPDESLELISHFSQPDFAYEKTEKTGGLLFHMRRRLKDATLIFLANASGKDEAKGFLSITGGSLERWDPFTGSVSSHPYERLGEKIRAPFRLPPGGSLLLCVRPESAPLPRLQETESVFEKIAADSPLLIEAEQPNVLTLDYCDLALMGKTEKDLYFYDAQTKIFQAHGLPRNPWDSSVQFNSSIIDLNHFPSDSGFEAVFRFSAATGVNFQSLQAVVERPELFRLFVNGREATPLADRWWLDRAFGVYDIGSLVQPGTNELKLRSQPFTIYSEFEPIYLLGDFRLQAEDKGFSLTASRPLTPGPWNRQGLPLYGAGVRYRKTYILPEANKGNERYVLRLGEWKGSVASVRVNDRPAGFIAFKPYELDITDLLMSGSQTVTVTVFGTLKNTLGPHHNKPPLGLAWPTSFQKGAEGGYPAGSSYDTVGYGLFEDFFIERRNVR